MTLLDSSIKHIASKPTTGVFYLVPKPDLTSEFWYDRVDEPFTDEFEARLHFSFWRNVVADIVARYWNINVDKIIDLYASIPRGRVETLSEKSEAKYAIIHGGDSMVSPFQQAIRAFGLATLYTEGKVKEIIDATHEVIDYAQEYKLEQIVGKKLYE